MTHFDVAKLREDLIEYQEDMASPGFWDDTERAQRVSAHAHQTEMKIQHYETLVSRADDIEVMMELAEEEDDDSMAEEIRSELESVREDLDALRLTTLLNGEYDGCNALLSLHAARAAPRRRTGRRLLYRMYVPLPPERMGFKVREIDLLDGDEAFARVRGFLCDAAAIGALYREHVGPPSKPLKSQIRDLQRALRRAEVPGVPDELARLLAEEKEEGADEGARKVKEDWGDVDEEAW